ncbi:MAG TPA: cytochrome c biogenesis protein DipZ [Spirochaetia bacterium]|nr:cytochrome c biogenesis protein DipZ [Spirochaetia bacterium]
MVVLIVFAFVAGVVTILSPCILPVLPVVLSGSVGGGKRRPLGIITGFVVSFTVFTLTLSALVGLSGVSSDILRWVSAGMILAFGLIMVIPPLKNAFMRLMSRVSAIGGREPTPGRPSGYGSGVVLGLSLGLVWTPCVGPIMASVITLASSQALNAGSVFITLAYASGTAVPLFLIMLGGRGLLKKVPFLSHHAGTVQKVFGALMIVTAVAIATGVDREFQAWILRVFPGYGSGLTAIEDQGFIRDRLDQLEGVPAGGTIPREDQDLLGALTQGGSWLNSKPLTTADLEGRAVLIDFWTYSCINCIRTFPYLTAWDAAYRDHGLVIIGVHTPEFAFERDTGNVARAVHDFGIRYPVVQDNQFKIWRAFNNRYWPAHYLFDRTGKLQYHHFGEGKYTATEKAIQAQLGLMNMPLVSERVNPTRAETPNRTPEIYLGYNRAEGFASRESSIGDKVQSYSIPATLEQGRWALSGDWIREKERVRSGGPGVLALRFRAEKVYIVLGPVEGKANPTVTVTVNGERVTTPDAENGVITVDGYRLYQLYDGQEPLEGTVRIETSGPLAAYSFTFG